MKKLIFICTLPILLMTTQLSAGNLMGSGEADGPPPRFDFLDYQIVSEEEGINSTFKLEVSWRNPGGAGLLGHTAYESAAGGGDMTTGTLVEFEKTWIPAFRLDMLFSDDETGTIFILSGSYHERKPQDVVRNPVAGEHLYLNLPWSGLAKQNEFTTATVNSSEKLISGAVGLQAYTLQYENFGFTLAGGLSGESLKQAQSLTATDVGSVIHTLTGTQTTLAGGIWTGFSGSMILSDSDESAIYVTTEFNIRGHIAFNDGSITLDADGDHSHNLTLPAFTYAKVNEQRVSLTYVGLPDTEDAALFQLSAGLSLETAFGRDLIQTLVNEGEVTGYSPAIFLSFSYTM